MAWNPFPHIVQVSGNEPPVLFEQMSTEVKPWPQERFAGKSSQEVRPVVIVL